MQELINRHHLQTEPAKLAVTLRESIAAEHSRKRARGVMHPEVRIENIWDGLFPGRRPEVLRSMIVEYELAAHPVWPMPGCRAVLSALKRRGITLGIISNAQFYTPLFLEALLGADMEVLGFSPSLCLYSCDFEIAKPDQALFNVAKERLRALGTVPENSLMIGNSVIDDIVPAGKIGFMTALAALDRRSFAAPSGPEEEPDVVVTSLGHLDVLLGGHGELARA